MTNELKYIRSLDGLRAVAIILVMLFHFRPYQFFGIAFDFGWIGVQLFFVLSGYLITRILLVKKQNDFGYYVKNFYWRRVLRIFPLYYFYLLIVSVTFYFFEYPESFLRYRFSLFTYLFNYEALFVDYDIPHGIAHFWSLCVEEQFYLVWPFLVYFLSRRNFIYAVAAIVVLVPIIRWLLGDHLLNIGHTEFSAGIGVYTFTLSHFDAFAIGGLIPALNLQNLRISTGKWMIGSTLLVLVVGLINLQLFKFSDGNVPRISSLGYPMASLTNGMHIWSYTFLNLYFAIIILHLIKKGNVILEHTSMVNIGKVSYGMYIYHMLLLTFLKYLGFEVIKFVPAMFIVYLLVTYLISWLSFRYFESIFLKLKDRVKFQQN